MSSVPTPPFDGIAKQQQQKNKQTNKKNLEGEYGNLIEKEKLSTG